MQRMMDLTRKGFFPQGSRGALCSSRERARAQRATATITERVESPFESLLPCNLDGLDDRFSWATPAPEDH